MIDLFRWMHGPATDAKTPAEKPAKPAPRHARPVEDETAPALPIDHQAGALVRRDAILDRNEQVVGYELSLQTDAQTRLPQLDANARRIHDAALLGQLAQQPGESLLGERLAFIVVGAPSLTLAELDTLPARHTVLLLDSGSGGVDAERLHDLERRGFQFGLRMTRMADADSPLLDRVRYVRADTPAFDGIELKSLARRLRDRPDGSHRDLVLLAAKLESHDDFTAAMWCDFDHFEGPFVGFRGKWKPQTNDINRGVVLPLLGMLRQDAETHDLAERMRHEPVLTYRLLRYLNSPAIGLMRTISSVQQAITLLGRDKLYRWLSLLLFNFKTAGYQEQLMAMRVVARARTLELLSGKGEIPAAPDNLFLVGLFSELDQMLGKPMSQLIAQAAVPAQVGIALLNDSGPLAPPLKLARLAELVDDPPIHEIAKALVQCGIQYADYTVAANAATVWAHEMLAENSQ